MKGTAVLLLLALVPARAAASALDVRVRLEPKRTVVHGQMLLLVEVIHPAWARPRWEAPPFPGFWPERISTYGDVAKTDPRRSLRRTVFRRALFPTRAGTLEIPASLLRYTEPDGTEGTLAVPGVRARIDPLPEAEAPEGFRGLVGSVRARAELVRSPIVLGESTRLLVEVYGEANVWDLEIPDLENVLDADLEAFPARPRLHLGEHENRLTARRTFVWDLVPRRGGRFDLPPLRFPYFDPQNGIYRIARVEPQRLEVAARPSRAERSSPFAPSRSPPPLGGSALPLGLLGVAALGVTGLFLLRWARRRERLLRAPTRLSPRASLEAAREAIGTQALPALLARSVKSGITARHGVDVTGLTTEEIAARLDDPEALRLLTALDRIRFAGDPTPPESLLEEVARYVAEEPITAESGRRPSAPGS